MASSLYEHAYGVATFGAKPNAVYPAVRSVQEPYSTVADNPKRTAADLWGDLVDGRLIAFAIGSEPVVGNLTESGLLRRKMVSKLDISMAPETK